MYKIEQDIPAPSTKYPFSSMEVNDSFRAPLSERKNISPAAAHFAKRQQPEWKFSIKKISDTQIRVWRIK